MVTAVDKNGTVSGGRIYKSVVTAKTPIAIKDSVGVLTAGDGTARGSSDITVISCDNSTGVYEVSAVNPAAVTAGKYITGKDPQGGGFLRKIDSAAPSGANLILQTSQASMDEVLTHAKDDRVITLNRVSANASRKRTSEGEVREMSSSNGSLIAREYVPLDSSQADSGVVFRTERTVRTASATDTTGRLKITAQDSRKVTPPYALAMPVQAYMVDEKGQIETQPELSIITLSLVSVTHPTVKDTSGLGNYGAAFDKDTGMFGWNIFKEHASGQPYTATFRAESQTLFDKLVAEISVPIYVQPDKSDGESNWSTSFTQEASVNVEFTFEPNLRTSIETGTFGGLEQGEIIAEGDFGVDIEAFYRFNAAADYKPPEKELFKRTWTSIYPVDGLTVYQDITLSLAAQFTANASAAVSAEAFAGLSAHLEAGIRYNPETEQWDFVKGSNFKKTMTFNLGIQGTVTAELRLIPRIDVTFYKVATASFYLEPYLRGRIAAEYAANADILQKILTSQYQMTDMSAHVGIEALFSADLSVWKFNLWKMDKSRLFGGEGSDFEYTLFSLPTLSMTADRDTAAGSPLALTARVTDGKNFRQRS